MLDLAKEIIAKEEGFRAAPYLCSEFYVTIGYGTKLHDTPGMDPNGFCLRVDKTAARALLNNHLRKDLQHIERDSFFAEVFEGLNDVRKAVVLSMCYQLGFFSVRKFRKTIAYLAAGEYEAASVEMLDSRWYRQTKSRALRHSEMIKTGKLIAYYEG
jgi:lysozyme